MKTSVTATVIENYQLEVRTDHHAWVVDEPPELGGDGLGPNPFDLFVASLAACMAVTLYYHASEAGLAFERIWVRADGEWRGKGDGRRYHVAVTVRVRGDLSREELERLAELAERCPVTRLLGERCAVETDFELV